MYVTVDSTTGERKWYNPMSYEAGKLPGDAAILQESVVAFGGVQGDYLIYKTTDEEVQTRLHNVDCFEGDIVDGIVTALDFSLEDDKSRLVFTDDGGGKVSLDRDGTTAGINITCTITKPDDSTDTSFNEKIDLTCLNTLNKVVPAEAIFVNGVASFLFKPTNYGYYKFPADYLRTPNGEFRTLTVLPIKVYFEV